MNGAGTTALTHGSLIRGGFLDRTIVNTAGVIVTQDGLTAGANGVWNNVGNGAVFKISADESLLGEGQFNNLSGAFLKKSGGSGTSIIEWDVVHQGNMILVLSGELSFRGTTFLDGQLNVESGAILDFQGNTVFGESVSHAGEGTLKISGGTSLFEHAYQSHLDTVLTGNALIAGGGTMDFHRHLTVDQALLTGSGQTNLYADSIFSNGVLNRAIDNFAQMTVAGEWSGVGVLRNRSGGTMQFTGANTSLSGTGTLINENGANLALDPFANSVVGWSVHNGGLISLSPQSSLRLEGDLAQSVDGQLLMEEAHLDLTGSNQSVTLAGRLAGSGTISTPTNGLVVIGTVAPGEGIDQLQFDGDIEFGDSAIFKFEIGNGTMSDLISVSQNLVLDGVIEIRVLNEIGLGSFKLFEYGGSMTDNGLTLAPLPALVDASIFHDVQHKQIHLVVTAIPEPSAALAVLTTFLFFHLPRRKR
jgi:fibronectin-binding autotransporter adhesin